MKINYPLSNPAKKAGLFLIIVFLFGSCFCYKGPVSEYGHFRNDIKPKNFVDDKRIYNKIDTTVVYEAIGSFYLNEFYPIDNNIQGKSYLKFYANGKVSYFNGIGYDREKFLADPDYQLSRNDFDPAKSAMGYFFINKDELSLNFFTRHPDCTAYVSKSEIVIKNDTLIEKNITLNKNMEDLYVKKNIPIEFLEGWKPDW